jgi:hypothetical protein
MTELKRASDPTTPAEVLAKLAYHSSPDVIHQALMNPSTPLSVLLARLAYEPEYVTRNPAWSLHLFEQPHLLHHIEIWRIFSVGLDPAVIPLAFHMKEDHISLAIQHYRCHPRLAALASEHENVRWRILVAHCQRQKIEIEQKLACDPEESVRGELAMKTTHAQVIELLLNDPSPVVLCRLAENPHLSRYTVIELARSPHVPVRLTVARRMNLPDEARRRLKLDEDMKVRVAINGGLGWW